MTLAVLAPALHASGHELETIFRKLPVEAGPVVHICENIHRWLPGYANLNEPRLFIPTVPCTPLRGKWYGMSHLTG